MSAFQVSNGRRKSGRQSTTFSKGLVCVCVCVHFSFSFGVEKVGSGRKRKSVRSSRVENCQDNQVSSQQTSVHRPPYYFKTQAARLDATRPVLLNRSIVVSINAICNASYWRRTFISIPKLVVNSSVMHITVQYIVKSINWRIAFRIGASFLIQALAAKILYYQCIVERVGL